MNILTVGLSHPDRSRVSGRGWHNNCDRCLETFGSTVHIGEYLFALYLPLILEFQYSFIHTFPSCLFKPYSQWLIFLIVITTTLVRSLLLFILCSPYANWIMTTCPNAHLFQTLWWTWLIDYRNRCNSLVN